MSTFLSNGALQEDATEITASGTPHTLNTSSPMYFRLVGTVAQEFRLVDSRLFVPGIRFAVGNRTTEIATIKYPDTSTLVEIPAASYCEIRLISNGSANGNWDVASSAGVIGPAEDGSYTDGLFDDFTASTPIGTATDRFNEILKALAPPPAPTLSSMDMLTLGVVSRLSWGSGHVISGYFPVTTDAGNTAVEMNDLYTPAGTRCGAYNGSANRGGALAPTITAHSQGAYPARAFGPGNQGILRLEVNGVVVTTLDLTSFVSGSQLTPNNSGFAAVSATTPVQFPNGTLLDLFQYRTGYWQVGVADQRLGFNYVRVIHRYNAIDHVTNYLEWVNDTNAVALTGTSGALHNLQMTGLRYLSGIAYHTAGTANYDVLLDNAQKNLYSPGNAVTYNGTNCSVPSQTLPFLGPVLYENATVSIVDAVATVSTSARLLNGSITVSVNCAHPLKAALSTAASSTITGLLMDPILTASTDLHEGFDAETIRLMSVAATSVSNYATQANVPTGAWNSLSRIDTFGSAGYTDGLLYYNSACRYPTQGVLSGNFGAVAQGPPGNPDYSSLTGIRYLYFKIKNNDTQVRSNFRLYLLGTGTFRQASLGPSGQALTLEMKFPQGSISGGTAWMDCYLDFLTDTWAPDGVGCRNGGQGAGQAFSTNWGVTLGTQVLAPNEYLVFRLGAASSWTGSVSDVLVTIL